MNETPLETARAAMIANAAKDAMDKGSDVLDAALVGASSDDIVRAIDYILKKNMPEAARIMLAHRLRARLTREHVAAQKTMTAASDTLAAEIAFLNKALVVLTAVLVILGAPDFCGKVHDWWTGWRANSAWEAWARK